MTSLISHSLKSLYQCHSLTNHHLGHHSPGDGDHRDPLQLLRDCGHYGLLQAAPHAVGDQRETTGWHSGDSWWQAGHRLTIVWVVMGWALAHQLSRPRGHATLVWLHHVYSYVRSWSVTAGSTASCTTSFEGKKYPRSFILRQFRGENRFFKQDCAIQGNINPDRETGNNLSSAAFSCSLALNTFHHS